MDKQLASALRRHDHVLTTRDLRPAWILTNAVREGLLVRLFPRTYVDAAHLAGLSPSGQLHLRGKAALRHAGPAAVLSHRTALSVWGLTAGFDEPVHLTVPRGARLAGTSGLVVHRRCGHIARAKRRGLAVSPPSQALVDAWPALAVGQRTGMVLDAVRRGEATIGQLEDALAAAPKLRGRQELRRLLGLFKQGCRSVLEIWGAMEVFTGPVLRHLERQVVVRVGRQVYCLDLFHRLSRVAFELDGAAFHGSKAQRERDLRRDADLATVGILVVRFSYDRLVSDPDGVRRQALSIIRSR